MKNEMSQSMQASKHREKVAVPAVAVRHLSANNSYNLQIVNKQETSIALRQLAFRICAADRKPARMTDTAEREALGQELRAGILVEDAEGVRFASEVLLVKAATQRLLETERDRLLASPKTCFERLDEVFGNEIGEEQMVCGMVLAELHNAAHLDAFSWGRLAIKAGVGVFDVSHVLENAIQFFDDARAESIFEFCSGHYEKTKNDLAGGLIYIELGLWLTRHPDVAQEIKQLHEANPAEGSGGLYGCALTAAMTHDFAAGHTKAFTAAQSAEVLVSGPSLHALGLANYSNPEQRRALDATIRLCVNIFHTGNHPNLQTAFVTLTRLLKFDEATVAPLLDEAGRTGTPEALYALSVLLHTDENTLRDKPWFLTLLMHLAVARTEHTGILDNIDFVLVSWLRNPSRLSHVVTFINTWIARQPADIFNQTGVDDAFRTTIHRIAELPGALSRILTSWLLDDDWRYPLVASKLIFRLQTNGLAAFALDLVILDKLDEGGLRFLVRRMLGYLSGNEVLIRLLLSLAYTRDAKTRTFGFIRSTYLHYVGRDYPYQTVEFLKQRSTDSAESEDVRNLADDVAEMLQSELDALNALPALKEFMPPSEKSTRFAKERHRQMNEAIEDASKDSIWQQIATHIPLKAGRRTFQRIQGRYSDVTELKPMSHSVALPRSEICDPAGAARERVLMRRVKRDDS